MYVEGDSHDDQINHSVFDRNGSHSPGILLPTVVVEWTYLNLTMNTISHNLKSSSYSYHPSGLYSSRLRTSHFYLYSAKPY